MGIRTSKHFKPIGRCIYCDKSDLPLGREHIVAYGLGGDATLPKASCYECARTIKKYEDAFMRGSFWAARTHMGFRSRHKERPSSLKLRISLTDRTKSITLPIEDFPSALLLPYYNTPFSLRDGPHTDNRDNLHGMWHHIIRHDQDRLNSLGIGHSVPVTLDLWSFAKMLAKIGHAFAVGVLGLNKFKPLLLDTIFDEAVDPHHLVGGSPNPQLRTPKSLHQTTLRILEYPHRDLVVADIQLFSAWGAPLYHVIVGEAPPLALREPTIG